LTSGQERRSFAAKEKAPFEGCLFCEFFKVWGYIGVMEQSNVKQYFRQMVKVREQIPSPDGFQFSCIEDFVNKKGEAFESKPLTEDELGIVLKAANSYKGNFALKECFYNSQTLVFHDETETLKYHEGYACGIAGLPVHHGWATINNKVIDMTWRLKEARKQGFYRDRILGVFPEHYEYFGVSFKTARLRAKAKQRSFVGTVLDDWENGYPLLRGEIL
jgi:hypothetical protein